MRSIQKGRRRFVIGAITAGILVVLIAGIIIWRIAASQSENAPQTTRVTPPFQALLPKDTSADRLGGWQKLTPPDGTSVYVFVDTMNKVKLRVSQQPLPKAFQTDTAKQVGELAKGYNANRSLNVGDIKVYIGTSAQGPQSVIFTKNGLLVLIKSDAALPDPTWIDYVAALQ